MRNKLEENRKQPAEPAKAGQENLVFMKWMKA